MTILTLALTLGVVAIAIVFAIVEVFWPLSVGVVAGLVALWWWGGVGALWTLWRPEYIAVYVVCGLGWLFFRWTRLVETQLREERPRDNNKQPHPPRWSEHSDGFSAYFFFWPVDMVGYVLSDLLMDAWDLIVKMVARSFDRYAEWRYKKAHGRTW